MEIRSTTPGPSERVSPAQKSSKRKFHKLGAAVALFSTLTFGGFNFSGPRFAKADTVEVDKVRVEVSKVHDTIVNLDKKTAATYAREDGVISTGD